MARLEELERKFEENPRRYFAPLANEYRKAGDSAKAAELCRSQLPEVPGHISGHIVLGQSLFDSGDLAGARTALETALALDPENIVALRYLGDIARNTGDTADAERWYSRTLEADPYNEAATQGLQALRAHEPAAAEGEVSAAPPTGEDAAPAESAAPEEGTQSPAHAAIAEGFEPTAHVFEPVPGDASIESGEQLSGEPSGLDAPSSQVGAAESDEIAPTAALTPSEEVVSVAVPAGVEERSPEPAPADAATETFAEPESTAAEPEPMVAAAAATEMQPAPSEGAVALQVEDAASSAEFAGDLAISAESESADESTEVVTAAPQPSGMETAPALAEFSSPVTDEGAPEPAAPLERFDVEAHESTEADAETPAEAAPDRAASDDGLQAAEERVLESAAPFVTETMADLYLEQGYPHEALELLMQLAEQRPDDERLREKVADIESVIAARRDAVVAAARAERAETAQAADSGPQAAASEAAEGAPAEGTGESVWEPSPDAPFDAAVAEVDSSAFAELQPERAASAFGIPPFLPAEEEAPATVRELFARMDRARPRPPSSVTPRPLSRLRSDFAPMPDPGESASGTEGDPFAFPDAPRPEQRVARTSGPHPTFNPSTADLDDFEAWLRGLKGS